MSPEVTGFSFEGRDAGTILLPGEGMSFRHLMVNCPVDVVVLIKEKISFARKNSEGKSNVTCSIEGLSLI